MDVLPVTLLRALSLVCSLPRRRLPSLVCSLVASKVNFKLLDWMLWAPDAIVANVLIKDLTNWMGSDYI